MPTPYREACFAALAAQLAGQITGVPVQRNRRAMVDVAKETLPRHVLLDGDHQARGSDAAGTTLYRVQATIQGWVSAASDELLGGAVNGLHASVVAAICNQEILVAGEQNIWPEEEGMQLAPFSPEASSRPVMGFEVLVAFDLRVPDTGGPYTTT
jgi:hypothetical protein